MSITFSTWRTYYCWSYLDIWYKALYKFTNNCLLIIRIWCIIKMSTIKWFQIKTMTIKSNMVNILW